MEISLLLDGNRMAVSPLPDGLRGRLEQELHYVKTVHLRGEEARFARTNVQFVPTDCYRYVGDRLITNAGFLQRVKKVCTDLGLVAKVKDLNPLSADVRKRRKAHPDRLAVDELRYKQADVLATCSKFRRCRIDCPTGYGKSYLFRHAIKYWPHAKIDIISPGADTAKDLYESLSEVQGGVGLFGAGMHIRGSRVQIYCVSSLHHCKFDADIVLADEIQEYATEKRLAQLVRYEKAYMYGLSASHDARNDNADMELEALFGPITMSVSYQEAVKAGLITQLQVRWLPVVMDHDPGADLSGAAKERHAIWRNLYRNRIVRDAAREYPGEQLLIVVKCIEHMAFLKKLLPDFQMVHAAGGMSGEDRYKYIKWGLFDETEPIMTVARREMLKKQFEEGTLRKVIVNSVWNRGVNFHKLSVLIRADASASKICDIQIPGRLSRLDEGKDVGLLIDLMDQFSRGYRAKAKSREKTYEEKGWQQTFPQLRSRFKSGLLE